MKTKQQYKRTKKREEKIKNTRKKQKQNNNSNEKNMFDSLKSKGKINEKKHQESDRVSLVANRRLRKFFNVRNAII